MKRCPYLFPLQPEGARLSSALLVLRVVFGLLLANHGWMKLTGFSEMSTHFLPLFGMSPAVSLSLAIFGEFFCSIAVIFGFLTRLAAIPAAFTMLIAFTVAHGCSIAEGELAFAYLIVFVVLIISGGGRYSIDYLLAKKCFNN